MTPDDIIKSILDLSEIEAMKRHLVVYQKSGSGRNWDEYRKKIDYDLLYKWGNILKQCRENGFVNPKVRGNEIGWYQLRGSSAPDKCYLCSEECRGTSMITQRGKGFKPCWK